MEYLDRAIDINRQAVELVPRSHPNRAMYLNNLGNSLESRFERTGSMENINRAVDIMEQAVDSKPVDSPGYTLCLSNLGKT